MCQSACMKVGHHQKMIRKAFIFARGDPVPTSELMMWCYPRRDRETLERWRWNDVARAAHRFGVNVRRGWWAPNLPPATAHPIRVAFLAFDYFCSLTVWCLCRLNQGEPNIFADGTRDYRGT